MSACRTCSGQQAFGEKGTDVCRRWAALVALCACASWPSLSRADDTSLSGKLPAPGDKDDSWLAGQALAAKKYEIARDLYSRACEQDPKTENLLGLAISEFYADHQVEAAAHFRQYLARADAVPDKAALVRAWLQGAEAHIAHLEIHIPAGAQLSVDGSPVDRDPSRETAISIDVRPGSHELAAHRGASSQVRYVVAQGGQRLDIEFPGAEPPATGGAPSTPPLPAPPSSPTLAEPSGSGAKWATAIAFGSVAVASAGIATGFAISFAQKGADADRLRSGIGPSGCGPSSSPSADCSSLHGDVETQRTNGALATGFYIGAGVAAAGALGVLLLWPSHRGSAPTGWQARPLIGAEHTGFIVSRPW